MKLLITAVCAIFLLTGCNSGENKEAALLKAKQATVDSMRAVIEKQAVIDSMKTVAEREREEERSQIVANNNAVAASHVASAPVAKKKKWNNTAKGAVIGAGTGAVAGALIGDKDRAKGALIGSVIGASAGTGTGLIIDHSKKKKSGAN